MHHNVVHLNLFCALAGRCRTTKPFTKRTLFYNFGNSGQHDRRQLTPLFTRQMQDDEAVEKLQGEIPKRLADVPDSMCPV